ncbi:M14 family zinc carboxypeptidase [Neobacillus sp. LXY-1]|uniref:M14 family zinc carboxypeptidase n=1 Tax=Neobacillus sp. LXY-1 TaxID=3379133 RepID=UPI003EE39006
MIRPFVLLLIFTLFSTEVAEANIVKVNKPYTFDVMERDLAKIKGKYNIEVKSIGSSHFGREIWAAKLGEGKKQIVCIGAHHGREWLTSMILMKMLETYASAYSKGDKVGSVSTDILDEVSIWFIPMLNPDGVTIQQNRLSEFPIAHQRRLQVMNDGLRRFNRWKANGTGIDLNRQYPAGWKQLDAGPSHPYYQYYKGIKPLEANEVKALTNFIKEINPSIAVAYHTAGREIFWHYHNGRQTFRDYFIARRISRITGYKLSKPNYEAVGGGFTDWFITKYHRPAMTIELSYLVGETSPPLSVFLSEWKRNKLVGLTLAEEARKLSP